MSNSSGNNVTIGSSLAAVLTVVFITLKLCNVIDWSWWWVVSPMIIKWVGTILLIILLLVAKAYVDR